MVKFEQTGGVLNFGMKTYDLEQILVATITDIPQYDTELLEQYDKYNP